VLLVEDEYLLTSDMAEAFAECVAEVIGLAGSVGDALAIIEGTPDIDAAVLDINLKTEMVFPVADALAARGIPFLFATGYDRAVIPPRFAAVTHCEKPVAPDQVAAALLAQPATPR